MAILFVIFSAALAYASVTTRTPASGTPGELQYYNFFSATTTTATSTNAGSVADNLGTFKVVNAEKITFYFTHGGTATTSTGTSTFSVQINNGDGVWHNYSKLVTGTSSAAVASVIIAGATSTVSASISDIVTNAFQAVRCVVLDGTNNNLSGDGEHSCNAVAQF